MLGLWVHCQNSIWVYTLDRIVSSSNKSNRLPSKAHLLLPIDMQWKIGIQKERFTDRELRKPFVLYVEHRDMLTAILPTPPQTNKNFEHENQSPLPSILNAMVECRQLKKFGCNGKIFYREWKKIIPPILQDWTASIVQSCQCQRLKCMPRKTFLNVCVCASINLSHATSLQDCPHGLKTRIRTCGRSITLTTTTTKWNLKHSFVIYLILLPYQYYA